MSTASSSASSSASTSAGSSSSKPSQPVHLIVLCHGLWGEPKHLNALETLLQRSFGKRASITRSCLEPEENEEKGSKTKSPPSKKAADAAKANGERQERLLKKHASEVRKDADMDIVILNTWSNVGGKTYDGIDWLAERVVGEIKDQQTRLAEHPDGAKHVARFSMFGYSLGGLVARCVIGFLESQGFFNEAQARQLITIASPHIGSPPGTGAFGKLVGYVGERLLSRTGEQLFSIDKGWAEEKVGSKTRSIGLLECMTMPDSVFMRGLQRFQSLKFYANAVNDIAVPFRSGCIESYDPFTENAGFIDVKLLSQVPIITQVSIGDVPLETQAKSFFRVPPLFNPNRLPFGFPWNYVVVFGSPILIPVFTLRILHKLSSDSRKSRDRILDLERGWEAEQKGTIDSRIDRLLKSVILGGGDQETYENALEEPVTSSSYATDSQASSPMTVSSSLSSSSSSASSASSLHPSDTENANVNKQDHVQVDLASSKPPSPAPWSSTSAEAKAKTQSKIVRRQTPLLPAQENMVKNLNDASLLPNLAKIWTYYPNINNAHAIIMARTLSIEPHAQGLPLIKYIVDGVLC